MKKLSISIMIAYIILMLVILRTMLLENKHGITPIIIGVIFVVYATVLIIKRNDLTAGSKEAEFNSIMKEYTQKYNKQKENMDLVRYGMAGFRHDYANHAQVLMAMVDIEEKPDRDIILEEIRKALIDNVKVKYSDNDFINNLFVIKIKELIKHGYMVEEEISVYGIKDCELYNIAFKIWFIIDVLEKYTKKDDKLMIKFDSRKLENNTIRITYKLEGIKDRRGILSLGRMYEYKVLNEILSLKGDTIIVEDNGNKLVMAGWLEV